MRTCLPRVGHASVRPLGSVDSGSGLLIGLLLSHRDREHRHGCVTRVGLLGPTTIGVRQDPKFKGTGRALLERVPTSVPSPVPYATKGRKSASS